MRLWISLGCLVLVAGCSGPHSTGALWAQQDIEQEGALFRVSDAQKAEQAHAFEVGLADADLSAERARIGAGLADCPGGTRAPLGVSSGDRLRDGIRLRVQDDPPRLANVAQVALADWRLRRAQATGDARFCDGARQALAGSGDSAVANAAGLAVASTSDPLSALGDAVVSRDPQHAVPVRGDWSVSVTVSNYALGYVDAVQAASPLPQYLAAVYGGTLVQRPTVPDLGGQDVLPVVDQLAAAYPAWEPDAIYQALVAQ